MAATRNDSESDSALVRPFSSLAFYVNHSRSDMSSDGALEVAEARPLDLKALQKQVHGKRPAKLTQPEEAWLILQAQAGDQLAWEVAYNQFYRLARHLAAREFVAKSCDIVDDELDGIVNQVLLNTVRKFENRGLRFGTFARFQAKAAFNEHAAASRLVHAPADTIRSDAKHSEKASLRERAKAAEATRYIVDGDAQLSVTGDGMTLFDAIPCDDPDPEFEYARNLEILKVRWALTRLSRRDRIIYCRRHMQGFTAEQVASELACSRSLVHHVMREDIPRKLRVLLKSAPYFEELLTAPDGGSLTMTQEEFVELLQRDLLQETGKQRSAREERKDVVRRALVSRKSRQMLRKEQPGAVKRGKPAGPRRWPAPDSIEREVYEALVADGLDVSEISERLDYCSPALIQHTLEAHRGRFYEESEPGRWRPCTPAQMVAYWNSLGVCQIPADVDDPPPRISA